MKTQLEKGIYFRSLHDRAAPFVMPNAWDAGIAQVLSSAGFLALATTSSGFAHSVGARDHEVGRDRMIVHVRDIAAATDLPVSGDLENGYGDDPAAVAETIRLAAEAGLVGASIEDCPSDRPESIYDLDLAVERIRAASEAARALAFPFTLTARAENFIVGRPDLADTIRRLQGFQNAGADVLFAPGVTRPEDVASIVRSVDRPVNVLAGLPGMNLTLADLTDLGVKRISVGGALRRLATAAVMHATREIIEHGTFAF
jgi:2-methylisocitrate lyase-like PEP mutase family enzyme